MLSILNPNYTGIRDITEERDWPYGKEVPYGHQQSVSQTPIRTTSDDCRSWDRSSRNMESDRTRN